MFIDPKKAASYEWACQSCTVINPPGGLKCNVCGSEVPASALDQEMTTTEESSNDLPELPPVLLGYFESLVIDLFNSQQAILYPYLFSPSSSVLSRMASLPSLTTLLVSLLTQVDICSTQVRSKLEAIIG